MDFPRSCNNWSYNWLWILAKIFFVIDTELDASVLESLASIIESFIVVIFITVILISYGFMLIITPTVKK